MNLGEVYIKWTNYLGEPGEMRLSEIQYLIERGSEIDLIPVSPPKSLTLEEPTWVKLMLVNRS